MSKADLFIATFGGSGGAQGLRSPLLLQQLNVRVAFNGIDGARRDVERGFYTEEGGKLIIDGHKQVIRDYIHDLWTEAKLLATSGRASDVPALSRLLSQLLTVARNDMLVGREDVAEEGMSAMVAVVNTFSERFAATCSEQTFPQELAFGLERQLLMLGTGTSVAHCARRRVVADVRSWGVTYHLESCTLPGLTQDDDHWTVELSGALSGKGTGSTDPGGLPDLPLVKGGWEASWVWRGERLHFGGGLEVVEEAVLDAAKPPVAPSDAGPLAKRNLRPSAPVPTPIVLKSRTLKKIRMQTIRLDQRTGSSSSYDTAEAEIVTLADTPCRPKQAPGGHP